MYQPPSEQRQQPPWQLQREHSGPYQPQQQYPPGPGSPPLWQPNQLPPYQQPTYYPPPQQPYYPPSMFVQPPPKRNHGCLIAIGVLVALFIFGSIINAVSGTHGSGSDTNSTSQATDTPVPTDTPSRPLKWMNVQAFSGNGQKKTSVFTVPDHWRLKWKCNPASDYFGSYNVIIDVYASDGSFLDGAINTICQRGNTSGDTEEYQGGDIYLDAQIDGAWAITVQALQ